MEPTSTPSSEFSHPTSEVRHSYPLAIRDASFGVAAQLLMKTMPYAMVRFGILVVCSLVAIVWTLLALGGMALLGSKIHGLVGFAWLLVFAGVGGYFWRTLVRYGLYMIKAGHIAVLTELITRGEVSHGQEGMFQYGRRVVTERFGQMNAMFALDLLVHGVVVAFNRTLNWIANLLPIPGLSNVTAVVNQIVRASATYVDETILSYSLARGDDNSFRSSRDGLIYYAQNSKEVLKTGVMIVILEKVLMFCVWLVMLGPAFVIAWILPDVGLAKLAPLFFAWLFASNVRGAFLEPLFLIMVMTKFHVCAENQAIDLDWDGKLSNLSDKFVQLKDKMASAGSTGTSLESHRVVS
ncbi:MAG: hypothetical protein OXU20_01250 [Myxococcales bacterium]|nr:hypothetical protein [Myxococcales bacterium]